MSSYDDDKIAYFAETDFRGKVTKFGIKNKDRSRHIYVIGKTGMGKSTLLENLAIQDIQNDEGLIFVDPHGSSAVNLLDYIPKHRIDDVVYFAPHDTEFPIAFNILDQVPKDRRTAVAGGIVSTFKKIWVDSFSSRMEYLMNYTLLALLDVPGTTLLGINRLLTDVVYRKYILDKIDDPLVRSFWFNEYVKFTATYASEAAAPIQNKVGQYIASNMIRNIVGQPVSTIDFRACMDQKKIVIINISKGIIGPENMRLLGGMLITKIQLAAMSRANLSREALERCPNTFLYVDEFQNFANESFAEILSESRKYKLCLTVANQYVDQMTEEVRNAVIGNVGTFISFRVGSTDAELMEREFAPQFTAEDMVNLDFAQIYLKLMIDGIGSRAFSAKSLPPIPKPSTSYVKEIIAMSRKYYSRPKGDVEQEIKVWTNKDFKLEAEKEAKTKKNLKDGLPKKIELDLDKDNEDENVDDKFAGELRTGGFDDFASQFKPEGAVYSQPSPLEKVLKAISEKKLQTDVKPEPIKVVKPAVPKPPINFPDDVQPGFSEKDENMLQPRQVNQSYLTRKSALNRYLTLGSKTKIDKKVDQAKKTNTKKENTMDEIPEDILKDLLNID